MISSKKITLIGILLIAVVFAATVYLIVFPSGVLSDNLTGDIEYSELHTVSYSEDDYYSNYSEFSIAKINLNGITATSMSNNVLVEGSEITILGGGTYVITGELADGNIIVDANDGAEVRLVLNGVNVTSSDFAALYVKQAEKVVISLVNGTENYFTDADSYSEARLEDGKPAAALYSKDNLTINGNGTLIIKGNYQDGIKVNDVFKVTGGTVKVTSVDDGINVNDYIAFLGAAVEVTSGGDAIKCENESAEYGFIALEGTTVAVTSGGDGIYASSSVYANEVTSLITAGEGSANAWISADSFGGFGGREIGFGGQTSEDTVSTKAIKATDSIVINSGEFTLDSADDAVHSDGDISINGGSFTIASGDDALHAEKNVTLNPETLKVTKCREGIEGAFIVINGGDISIISNDDGINAVGENASGGFGRPMGMQKENITDENIYLTINGGNIYIETSGDGVDSNGAAVVNGGQVKVYGPENNGNSSLDFEYGFIINGGSVLAAGSSGMAELPSDSSAQRSIVFYLDENIDAGSTISVVDSDGNEIITGTSAKRFDWVCISTAEIAAGGQYIFKVNGANISTAESKEMVTSSGTNGRRR